MRAAAIGAGVVIVAAALASSRAQAAAGPAPMLPDLSELFSGLGGAMGFSVSRIADARPGFLDERNVRAFLRLIRSAEGTAGADGYRMLFGGALFEGFADHPRVTVERSGYRSTAAGAYQFLASTWDETARALGLRDFSPASQDLAALGRIAARGALDDVRGGRLSAAVGKCSKEWASLPGSPYGQPVITMDRARELYARAGGDEVFA